MRPSIRPTTGSLRAATAQAYTLLCDDNGCDDVLYPPQSVTLTNSGSLDRRTASDGLTSYTIGKRWRLTRGGNAAVANLRITCPAGVTVPLDSLDLWSARTARSRAAAHLGREFSAVSADGAVHRRATDGVGATVPR
jgi:hypothetical protein